MAKKRDKRKESIFVTNEYFEKCGVSRQVVRFNIEKEKIKPAGNLIATKAVKTVVADNRVKTPDSFTKSPFLYYMVDADFLVLRFWIENHKKYLDAVIDTWEMIKEEEPFKKWSEPELKELKIKLLDSREYMAYLPAKIGEFKKIVGKYIDFRTMEAKNREDFFCERFSREYITGIIQKNERFIHSKKTVTAFMLEESINKKQGKKHLEIRRQQMMRQWYEKGDFAKINELLAELEERKNAPPREGESSRFYRNAVEFHEMLKGKRGRKKRQKTKA